MTQVWFQTPPLSLGAGPTGHLMLGIAINRRTAVPCHDSAGQVKIRCQSQTIAHQHRRCRREKKCHSCVDAIRSPLKLVKHFDGRRKCPLGSFLEHIPPDRALPRGLATSISVESLFSQVPDRATLAVCCPRATPRADAVWDGGEGRNADSRPDGTSAPRSPVVDV